MFSMCAFYEFLFIHSVDGHMFIISRKGGVHLVHSNFVYRSNLRRQGRDLNKIYWECIYNRSTKCRGRLKTVGDQLFVTNGTAEHFLPSFFFSFLVVVVNSSGIFALEKEKQTQLQHKFIEIARIVSFG